MIAILGEPGLPRGFLGAIWEEEGEREKTVRLRQRAESDRDIYSLRDTGREKKGSHEGYVITSLSSPPNSTLSLHYQVLEH
jgi:hypothetical protein